MVQMPSVMLNMTLISTHLEQKLISLEIKQQPLVPVRKKAPNSSKVRGNSKIPRKFKSLATLTVKLNRILSNIIPKRWDGSISYLKWYKNSGKSVIKLLNRNYFEWQWCRLGWDQLFYSLILLMKAVESLQSSDSGSFKVLTSISPVRLTALAHPVDL